MGPDSQIPTEGEPATSGLASPPAEFEHKKAADTAAHETRLAILNTLKLSLSLVGTLVVAFAVRFLIPRYIGPERFGQLNFADAYAMSFFVFTTFGVDSYIRKEVSTRLEHANDFWAGFWLLRLGAAVVISGLMALGLSGMHKGAVEWRMAFIFAVGQIAFIHNFTVQSLLHAASEVNELAWMNVISKLVWGGGIYCSLVLAWPLETIAVWFVISEAGKALVLSRVCQRKLHLKWHVDFAATKLVLIASFPYFLNYMCHRTYEKLNVTMLSYMTNDSEVGWYSAATNIATISLLFLPIVQAIIIPLASRTGAKSLDAMNEIMRGAVRLIVVCGTLISLIIMLHADWMVKHAFGEGFSESAISLRNLAPMFPLTYLAVLGAQHLIQLDRIWTMIKVSLAALIINPLLNAPLIHLGFKYAPGYAGGLSAFASICTEGANAAITFYILGEAAIDRRFWSTLAKTALMCGIVSGVHLCLPTWDAWRMVLEIPLYFLLAVLMGALPVGDIRRMLLDAVASRRGKK
jgi:O-antigen/teichoic acid export membrane protein